MKVWIFSIAWNEARIAPWFLRHYAPWVDKMIVYCEPSTDGTEDILRACPKVDLRVWPYKGLDDEKFMGAVNHCYQSVHPADWVAFVDMDELLWHPNIMAILSQTTADVLQAKGYALLSPSGWPKDDGHSQLYELVKTGVSQQNYDKLLLARPRANMVHTIGRHTYTGQFPRFRGRLEPHAFSGLKLYHCHYFGGPEETAARNQRNYDRCVKKKYAWNMVNHDPKQVGTVEWVRESLNHLQQVWP